MFPTSVNALENACTSLPHWIDIIIVFAQKQLCTIPLVSACGSILFENIFCFRKKQTPIVHLTIKTILLKLYCREFYYYAIQAGLEFMIMSSHPHKFCVYAHMLPYLAVSFLVHSSSL